MLFGSILNKWVYFLFILHQTAQGAGKFETVFLFNIKIFVTEKKKRTIISLKDAKITIIISQLKVYTHHIQQSNKTRE